MHIVRLSVAVNVQQDTVVGRNVQGITPVQIECGLDKAAFVFRPDLPPQAADRVKPEEGQRGLYTLKDKPKNETADSGTD